MSLHPQSDTYALYFEIPPIELVVSRKPDGPGRTEHYSDAGKLMQRLDQIGASRRIILTVKEAAQAWDPIHVDALNHYLHAGRGMRSYKRVCRTAVFSKYGWTELRERLGIPAKAILIAV